MANCPHGLTTAHWFAGSDNYFDIDDRPDGVVRKYCAGPPRDWYFEHGWRRQLESQMDDHPLFTKFLEAQEIDASQVPSNVSPWSYEVWPSPSVDRLRNFIPLGWFGWGEMHWYGDTPIYDTVCEDLGFQPR